MYDSVVHGANHGAVHRADDGAGRQAGDEAVHGNDIKIQKFLLSFW